MDPILERPQKLRCSSRDSNKRRRRRATTSRKRRDSPLKSPKRNKLVDRHAHYIGPAQRDFSSSVEDRPVNIRVTQDRVKEAAARKIQKAWTRFSFRKEEQAEHRIRPIADFTKHVSRPKRKTEFTSHNGEKDFDVSINLSDEIEALNSMLDSQIVVNQKLLEGVHQGQKDEEEAKHPEVDITQENPPFDITEDEELQLRAPRQSTVQNENLQENAVSNLPLAPGSLHRVHNSSIMEKKNEKLFETSQKSVLVSIQKSKKSLKSQRNSQRYSHHHNSRTYEDNQAGRDESGAQSTSRANVVSNSNIQSFIESYRNSERSSPMNQVDGSPESTSLLLGEAASRVILEPPLAQGAREEGGHQAIIDHGLDNQWEGQNDQIIIEPGIKDASAIDAFAEADDIREPAQEEGELPSQQAKLLSLRKQQPRDQRCQGHIFEEECSASSEVLSLCEQQNLETAIVKDANPDEDEEEVKFDKKQFEVESLKDFMQMQEDSFDYGPIAPDTEDKATDDLVDHVQVEIDLQNEPVEEEKLPEVHQLGKPQPWELPLAIGPIKLIQQISSLQSEIPSSSQSNSKKARPFEAVGHVHLFEQPTEHPTEQPTEVNSLKEVSGEQELSPDNNIISSPEEEEKHEEQVHQEAVLQVYEGQEQFQNADDHGSANQIYESHDHFPEEVKEVAAPRSFIGDQHPLSGSQTENEFPRFSYAHMPSAEISSSLPSKVRPSDQTSPQQQANPSNNSSYPSSRVPSRLVSRQTSEQISGQTSRQTSGQISRQTSKQTSRQTSQHPSETDLPSKDFRQIDESVQDVADIQALRKISSTSVSQTNKPVIQPSTSSEAPIAQEMKSPSKPPSEISKLEISMDGMEEETPLRQRRSPNVEVNDQMEGAKEEPEEAKRGSEVRNSASSRAVSTSYQCLKQFPAIETPDSDSSNFSDKIEKEKDEIIQEIEQSLSSLKPQSHLSSSKPEPLIAPEEMIEVKLNEPVPSKNPLPAAASILKSFPISPLAVDLHKVFSQTFSHRQPRAATSSVNSKEQLEQSLRSQHNLGEALFNQLKGDREPVKGQHLRQDSGQSCPDKKSKAVEYEEFKKETVEIMERMKNHMKTIRDTLKQSKRPSSPRSQLPAADPKSLQASAIEHQLFSEIAESLVTEVCKDTVNKISSDTLSLEREYEIEKQIQAASPLLQPSHTRVDSGQDDELEQLAELAQVKIDIEVKNEPASKALSPPEPLDNKPTSSQPQDEKEEKKAEHKEETKSESSPDKHSSSERSGEKPSDKASEKANEIMPHQISLKQAQIQKELDELQQLQSQHESCQNQLIAGIDTSLETVDSYIEDIFSHIRERGRQFLGAFLTPILRDPVEYLSLLRQAQKDYDLLKGPANGPSILESFQISSSMVCILNVQLYLTLEKERESVIKEAIDQIKQQSSEEINEEELAEMISEADHIHNKAIFDSVNEAMNFVRPFGLNGQPMPWSMAERKNWFLMVDEQDPAATAACLEKVLDEVKSKVLTWANIRAGGSGGLPSLDKIFSDQVRQKAIEEVVRNEIEEVDEIEWKTSSENYMAQVKLELADHLFDKLVSETVDTLGDIEKQRREAK